MLKAVPTHWFSWDFRLTKGSRRVADIDVSWWREKGVLTVEGTAFQVRREGLLSGAFILESKDAVLARAEKRSALRRRFIIHHSGDRYELRARSIFGRSFCLLSGNKRVGAISPDGIFTRRATVDLPPELPLPVRVFIFWLAVIIWKREAANSAGAGAG